MADSDKFPFVAVTDALHECVIGWDKIAAELQGAIARHRAEKPILVVDCYPGVDELAVLNELQTRLTPKLTNHAADAYHSPEKIEKLVAPFLARCAPDTERGLQSASAERSQNTWNELRAPTLGPSMVHGKHQVSGSSPGLSLVNFFNAEPLWRSRRTIDELKDGLVLIVGCGASLIAWGHILVHAEIARREARERLRRNDSGNLGADNKSLPANQKHERALFVDWPVADRWKRPLIKRWDYWLDTNKPGEPKLADAEDVRRGFQAATRRPFRVSSDSLEENSLLLGFGDVQFEVSVIDLLFNQPHALLGETVHARFGDEFPIRLDVLKKTPSARFELLGSGDGWREERMELHEREFLEVRRHWFRMAVAHDTYGGINILNLVQGNEAIVESPDGAFEPFIVHHGETFIIPAAVGRYNIRPHGPSAGKEIATIKAFIRTL